MRFLRQSVIGLFLLGLTAALVLYAAQLITAAVQESLSEEGRAIGDVLDGFYDAQGKVPCQIDGGLKCFGHPIGASGLRMIYEMYLQMNGRAGARQTGDPVFGMTHNLGGFPSQNVSSITIVGQYGA